MTRRNLCLIAAYVLIAEAQSVFAESWTVDRSHSQVVFSIRHLVGRFTGKFDDFSVSIRSDETDPSVEFVIKAASIDTGNGMRDDHLRSADFFDVSKFSEITFKSTRIRPAARKNLYDVIGDLTMHGVTKRIAFPVEYLGAVKDARGREIAGFALSTTLNRKDYGISWNEALDNGGVVLGDDVEVVVNLEVIQK